MKRSKRPATWTRLRQLILWLFLGMLIVMLLGALLPTKWSYPQQTDCGFPIYVSSVNNFHAEIILPVNNGVVDWRQNLDLKQLGQEADHYQYLSFGWGDQKFFMEGVINPLTIVDALFIPGPTVMHVWGHVQPKLRFGGAFQLKQVTLSRTQYLKLAQFIQASFQLTPDHQPIYLRQGLYRDSGFYAATGTYSAFRTCNAWTVEALRLADVNTPVWSALAPAVMHHLKSDCPSAS